MTRDWPEPNTLEIIMTALINTLKRDCQVGIYDNCTAVARVYEDRTVATLPEVKWRGLLSIEISEEEIEE